MRLTIENTRYTPYIVTNKKMYDVTNALVTIGTSEEEKQIAESMSLGLIDVDVDGEKLSNLVSLGHRLILRVSDGKKVGNIFKGYVWTMSPKESLTASEFTIQAYDQLIYWQESEDSLFFEAGSKTSSIVKRVSDRWKIKYIYDYEDITHDQTVLRGAIADFMTADVLDTVKNRTGKSYVMRDESGSVAIRAVGTNKTIYTIDSAQNAIELRRYRTINGVINSVIIISTSGDDEKARVEATSLNMNSIMDYGTLKKIIIRSDIAKLADCMKEANNIISKKSSPRWEYDIKAADIPWIRKGDAVNVMIDTLKGIFIVKSISRDISNRGSIMTLTLVDK